MRSVVAAGLLAFVLSIADCIDPPCVIDLECAECIPENMPLVPSHSASDGSLTLPVGEELLLSCAGGRFLAYPLRGSLAAVCEHGRYRVRHDGQLRHLLDLGCQANIFEDVLHDVEQCGAPLQGRVYRIREEDGRPASHLATLCFDPDRAVAVRMLATNAPGNRLRLPPHQEAAAPLTILGNLNGMFDANTRREAERLYSDDGRTNRRLHEMLRYNRFSFAEQQLTSAKLLSGHYFEEQNARVAELVSNRVAVWGSVAAGNLRHLQRDVAQLVRGARPAEVAVYAGTRGVLALRTGDARTPLFLGAGGRFPVARYLWTVVHDRRTRRALALVLLNDPFVAVSEIKDSVFCESACGSVSWLHELRRNRNYEVPVNGLVFCCSFHNFTDVVTEMPRSAVDVPAGEEGFLADVHAM